MDKDEAVRILEEGKISAWKQYRDRNPDWEPDLSGVTFTSDLSHANLSRANICGTNFLKARMFIGGSYLASSTAGRVNLTMAKFDITTVFPTGMNPADAGAVFVSQAEHLQEGRSRTRDEFRTSLEKSTPKPKGENMIKIFISHSSQDQEMVALIPDLLLRALDLHESDIRCTSVPGFRLSSGVHTSVQLRNELNECMIIVGLLTKNSLASLYVMFELGAGWGLDKTVIPILGTDINFSQLHPPLSELHCITWDKRDDWIQLIGDLSHALSINTRPFTSWSSIVDRLLRHNPAP